MSKDRPSYMLDIYLKGIAFQQPQYQTKIRHFKPIFGKYLRKPWERIMF